MTTLIPKFDLMNGGSTPTGAINRTIFAKSADIISVKDFGATGDGITDDSAAINAALNYASTLVGGACVYFPPSSAKYKCNSGLTINTSNVQVNFGGCGIDFTGMTTGNAISLIRTQTDPNRQNGQNYIHPLTNGFLYGPSGANTTLTALYFNDTTPPNCISGGCIDNMSFINFGKDVYYGEGAYCIEFRHCNFQLDVGTPTTYSLNIPTVTNGGEKISFIGCMWNNRPLILNQAFTSCDSYFINCSFDYFSNIAMTVTGGSVYITESHIENDKDTGYWFSCTGTNALIAVVNSNLTIQTNKTVYPPFYSDSTCTSGGIVLDNVRLGGSNFAPVLIAGTGKAVVRNVLAPIGNGLPVIASYLNSLAYGGFESANYTAEWTLSAGAVRSTTQAKTGTYSLSLPATTSQTPIASTTIPCIAGQSFSSQFYYLVPSITGTGGTFVITYIYQDKGGNSLFTGAPLVITTNVNTWTLFNNSPQIITPTGTVSVKLNFTLFGVTSGTPIAYVDDVILNVV